MVIVPRITAVSYLDTVPFIYGLEHAADLRAGLSLSDFPASVRDFSARRSDLALVPAHVVPSLEGARIVTEYCLGVTDRRSVDFLLTHEPDAPARALFDGPEAPLAGLLASKKPWAYAVWVAREETDPERIEALRHALTFGLEHTYEALVASAYAERPYDAYDHLTHIDYIFDNQKYKALRKFWDSGMKVSPRANPG